MWSPSAIAGGMKELVGNPRQPNTKGLLAIVLTIFAIVALGFAIIPQSRAVAHASALQGYQARVITAVVVHQGFTGMTVDINGEDVRVAQANEAVPVGEPIRLRVNPSNPNYVVDARIEPQDAVAAAQRTRLITIVLALVAAVGAIYLRLAVRKKHR